MKKNQTILLVIALVAIGLLTLLFFRNPSKRNDWRPTYKEKSKEPYGTFVIVELLKNYFPGEGFEILQDSLDKRLANDSITNSNYVFVGEALFLDSVELQTLLNFVANGNTAFLSSRMIPEKLLDFAYDEMCEDEYWSDYGSFGDTAVRLNLTHPSLKAATDFRFKRKSEQGTRNYDWSHIDTSFFCEAEFGFTELGLMNDSLINFAKIPYGDGTFYLHATPLTFSNITMLDSNSLQYANRAFSHLTTGKIYWDEYSKMRGSPPPSQRNRALSKDSPLQYVLSQPPLAWAWYLLLAMAFLYLLFRTKRKQRIIPVLEPNTNTSLQFVSTIGRLYFLQNNHKQLALQKMKLWLNFVRERYHLRGVEVDDKFQQKLIIKSEVSEILVGKIFRWHHDIVESDDIVAQMLMEFHQLIEEFYRTCK